MRIQDLQRAVRNAGIRGACYDLAYRVGKKALRLTALQAVTLTPDTVAREFLRDDPAFAWGFLDEPALRAFARRPGLELGDDFVDGALAAGHRCYGVRQGDALVAYTWYARTPTALDEDLLLHFDPAWAYAYKGFTAPEHRGKRLLASGMARAVTALAGPACRGIVSVIERNNFSSLKGVHRLGCTDVGRLRAWRVLGRWRLSATRSCAPFGLRLTPR